MRYLICYDISSPQRLRRVARILERCAIRLQKSVFLMQGNSKSVNHTLETIGKEINVNEDIVQAWRLAMDQAEEGISRGCVVPVAPVGVIASKSGTFIITNKGREA